MSTNSRQVSNAASALGQGVGKLFEGAIRRGLEDVATERGHSIRPARLRNGTGNVDQIDAVVFDADDNPVIIIDPKYIRYTKHNRDKGSWLCVAHYNLRKTYPTIRKSIAVLAGRWSEPSKELIRSFGVATLEVPFAHMASTLGEYGVVLPGRRETGKRPALPGGVSRCWTMRPPAAIAVGLTEGIIEGLRAAVAQVLDADIATLPTRRSGVEVLLKTDRDEMLLQTFDSVAAALRAMGGLVFDRGDVSDLLAGPAD